MTIQLTARIIAIILLILAVLIVFIKEGRLPSPTELLLAAVVVLLL